MIKTNMDMDIDDLTTQTPNRQAKQACSVSLIGHPIRRLAWASPPNPSRRRHPQPHKDSGGEAFADHGSDDDDDDAEVLTALYSAAALSLVRKHDLCDPYTDCKLPPHRSNPVPAHKCGSVMEFLKGMYDVIEGHRNAVHHGLLHGDINMGNIVFIPGGLPQQDALPKSKDGKPRSVFIDEILQNKKSGPVAILVDLDDGRMNPPVRSRSGLAAT